MLVYLLIKRKKRLSYKKWANIADLFINNAIFSDEDEDGSLEMAITQNRAKKLMVHKRFRMQLSDKIISAAKSLSGQSTLNLQKFYLTLALDKYALDKVSSYSWHIRAKGIQEIGIMGLKGYLTKVYGYTNNKNDLVRAEAQITVLKLFGFEGLRFLDVITYQLTEWHQIRLLHELFHYPQEKFTGIDKWLKSDNTSVTVFALKLARIYHRFELYAEISACLNHPDPKVRFHAIQTLEDVYMEDTAGKLNARFDQEDIKNQLAIAKALQSVGSEDDIQGLIIYLYTDNIELKIAFARTLASIGEAGVDALHTHPEADQFPLNEIILQIDEELEV